MLQQLKPLPVVRKLREKRMNLFSPLEFKRVFDVSQYAAQWFIKTYTKKGVFIKLRKGLYMLADFPVNNYLIANRLYQPSYISFDTALSFYGLIPETIYSITSATTKITREFRVQNIVFIYHKIKKETYTGYKPIKYMESTILMAEPEKALADYLYFVALKKRKLSYERIDLRKIKKGKLINYAKRFKNKKLFKLIKNL